MSTSPRIDLLGLSELDSQISDETDGPRFFADDISLPAARSARIESRRAFVEMKQLFMRAVENLEHRKGAWLRAQVRAAEDPTDLWLLRGPLLSALREDELGTRAMRAAIYKSLDLTFPHAFGLPGTASTAAHRAAN